MNSARDLLPPEHSATEEYDQIIREHLKWQNEIEYQLGDTFDIKTSIALVIIIFLATQSGTFLTSSMPHHWHILQIVSAVCLIVAGVLAILELVPREYKIGLAPDEFLGWVKGVRDFYSAEGVSNPEAKSVAFIRRKQTEQMQERFQKNRTKNNLKSNAILGLFCLMTAALAINLATLAALATGWRF